MHSSTAAVLAGLAGLLSGAAMAPAFAQVATGNEISVNPTVAAGQTLLYPGGQYMRTVQPLLQPGQKPADSGPITLHMPARGTSHAGAGAVSKPAVAVAEPAPKRVAMAAPQPEPVKPAPEPKPKPAPQKAAAAAPPPASSPSADGFGAGNSGAAGLDLGAMPAPSGPDAPPPPRQQVAKAMPVPPPPSPAASVEPNAPGLTKRSVILFAAGVSDPAQSALDAIKLLAGDLNASMTSAGSRVQLIAYGGDKGDKGSDARRLSLKRALAIRQVLIDDGVPSERIDVRAMGGADDGGPADRVDVYVKV